MLTEPTQFADRIDHPGYVRRLLLAASSLKCKATGLVVVLTLAVSATVSGYLLQTGGNRMRDERGATMVFLASAVARAAAPILAEGNAAGVQALARESADGSPLLYVVIWDALGRQVAAAERPGEPILCNLPGNANVRVPVEWNPPIPDTAENPSLYLDVLHPITLPLVTPDQDHGSSGKHAKVQFLGYVRTGLLASAFTRAASTKLDLLVGMGLLATVAAIVLGFLLVRRVVLPLEGLGQMMIRFSHGELDVRSPVRRRDEIGRLEAAFNRMADQHQHTHERIIRLNSELERRVVQRTQQLRDLASREPLTSLYNRRFLNETMERRFAEALRYGVDLSCIMTDLDGFKAVNDEFGHQIGDELLQLTANIINSQLRSTDVAARFGGDEFVIVLPYTGADRARALAERIFEKFNQESAERFPEVRVTLSMGIASLSALEVKDTDCLLRTADHALYSAKAAGRNRIAIADETPKPTPA